MSHILLVEPDDDLCLFLRQAVCSAGHRPLITGSLAEARDALDGSAEVDVVITNVVLPDGSGLALAPAAIRLGKPLFLLRSRRRRIEISDGQGGVFRGTWLALGDLLRKAVLRCPRCKSAEIALQVESR